MAVNDTESTPLFNNSSNADEHGTIEVDIQGHVESDGPKKDNSVSVVFSLWSTMIGSTLLAMPLEFRNAGVYPSIVCLFFMMIVMCYTGQLMLRCGAYYGMTTLEVLASHHKSVRYVTLTMSVCIFLGAMSLYHVYLTESILAFANLDMSDTKWRLIVGLCVFGAQFLIGLLRSLGPIFKASSYCIIFIIFLIIFILIQSGMQLSKKDCTPQLQKKFGLGWNGFGGVAQLLSTLGVSLFCQNIMLQILSQATRTEKITRNCIIAWICTALSYGIPSVMAVIAFAHCSKFKGDFIAQFEGVFSDVARVAVICLVGVVYPLLLFAGRVQVLSVFFPDRTTPDNLPPYWAHVLNNLIILCITTTPTLVRLNLIVVASMTGCFALYWGIMFPCITYIRVRREQRTANTLFYIGQGSLIAYAAVLIIVTVLANVNVVTTAKPGADVSPSGTPAPTNVTQLLMAVLPDL